LYVPLDNDLATVASIVTSAGTLPDLNVVEIFLQRLIAVFHPLGFE